MMKHVYKMTERGPVLLGEGKTPEEALANAEKDHTFKRSEVGHVKVPPPAPKDPPPPAVGTVFWTDYPITDSE